MRPDQSLSPSARITKWLQNDQLRSGHHMLGSLPSLLEGFVEACTFHAWSLLLWHYGGTIILVMFEYWIFYESSTFNIEVLGCYISVMNLIITFLVETAKSQSSKKSLKMDLKFQCKFCYRANLFRSFKMTVVTKSHRSVGATHAPTPRVVASARS